MASSRAVQRCMKAIKLHNPSINAFNHVCDSAEALAAASEADDRLAKGASRGPLDGVPIAIKDNICVRGMPLTCASAILRGRSDTISPYSATVVEKLVKAGCIPLGKTNLDEFGMGSNTTHTVFGPVRNPRSLAHVAGGSSGGSAAAVASGMVDIALGSDTGGSVRLPASYCGVFALKPSYGMFSRWGLVSYASSLDTIGILASSTKHIANVLEVMAGRDTKDSTSCDIPRNTKEVNFREMRVGVPSEYFVDGLSVESKRAWDHCIRMFEEKGATIVPVSLPHTSSALPAYYIIALAEASSNLSRYNGTFYGDPEATEMDTVTDYRTRGFGEEVKKRIILGTFVLSSRFFQQAQKIRSLIVSDFENVFNSSASTSQCKGVDILITPASIGPAPTLTEAQDPSKGPVSECINDIMTLPSSLAGIPSLVLPFSSSEWGVASSNLPVGVQLLAPFGHDEYLMKVAQQIK
ncbi:hypothetical protein HDU67_006986 [Dinochytrium kinnereticum]|nr:hypothetical protein HDU67_006986 [Dinochytrium kinnereticum]